jgi:hypothetical protein
MTKAGEGRNENNRMFLNMLRFTRGDNVKWCASLPIILICKNRKKNYYVRYDLQGYVRYIKEHSISNIRLVRYDSPAFFLWRSPAHKCLRTTVINFEDKNSFPNTRTCIRVFGKGGAKRKSPFTCFTSWNTKSHKYMILFFFEFNYILLKNNNSIIYICQIDTIQSSIFSYLN